VAVSPEDVFVFESPVSVYRGLVAPSRVARCGSLLRWI